MRNLYLIRHGKVSSVDGKKHCIGRTDTPLDEEGRGQARALAAYFAGHPVRKVYASPLSRARETAELLADGRYPVLLKEDLIELDMGEWEDIPLNELKKELTAEPAKGEGRKAGKERFVRCIEEILSEMEREGEGDVAVVAHAGVLCAYLSGLLGTPLATSRALPQPYGGFSRILVDGKERKVAELGRMPQRAPDQAQCAQLWERSKTPEPVRKHCRAVCREALFLGRQLIKAGAFVDIPLLTSGALLHDLMRHKKDHPGEGARCLLKEGYPLVAELIIRHHDWERRLSRDVLGAAAGSMAADAPYIQEREGAGSGPTDQAAAILYLADKRIWGTERVTIEQRFEKSRERCLGCADEEQALEAWQRRYGQAREVQGMVQRWLKGQSEGGPL